MQWFEQIAVTRVLTAKQKNMDVPLALKDIGGPIGLMGYTKKSSTFCFQTDVVGLSVFK